jgi:hypothetical protein
VIEITFKDELIVRLTATPWVVAAVLSTNPRCRGAVDLLWRERIHVFRDGMAASLVLGVAKIRPKS